MILTEAGFEFEVRPVDIVEDYHDHLHASQVARFLAEKKAKQFPYLNRKDTVIAADTTVVVKETILGKPEDADEAKTMLSALSNGVHTVITGVCIKDRERMISFDEVTRVHFKQLTDREIDFYIREYEPYDKAGSYGIQEWIGMIGVTKIEGSYFNVMGLPIHRLYQELTFF
jgi:septum formation protein